jgi:type IV pilus assembly protein PilQ
MKQIISFLFLLIFSLGNAQDNRIQLIKNNLDAIIPDVPGLSQKVDINIKETSLSNFLIAVSEVHKVNIV